MNSDHKETQVDVLVLGGSTAGCAIAGRLAFANSDNKVMIIEAGADNRNDPTIYVPGMYPKNVCNSWNNDKATFYEDSEPSQAIRGRRGIIPCANVLGGGSSVNEMNYIRAAASDFDALKMDEWKADNIIHLMKRLENFQKPTNDRDLHGYQGPIDISNGQLGPLASDFMRAAQNAQVQMRGDLEDLKTGHGVQIQGKLINKFTGRRSDAATAYVHPVMDYQSNLQVLTNSRVSRIIFEGNKAVGAAYIPARPILSERDERNSECSPDSDKDKDNNDKDHKKEHEHVRDQEIIIRAKVVIVACGAIGTPLLLQRSGVGKEDLLKKHGIKVVSNLPHVGENLRDHLELSALYRVSQETKTPDDFFRGMHHVQRHAIHDFMVAPESAMLATNFADCQMKLRPRESELKEFGSGFQKQWDSMFEKNRDRPLLGVACFSGALDDHTMLPPGNYFTMRMESMYPVSEGKVCITSTDPNKAPFLDTGFLRKKQDMAALVWGYKKTREIARRTDAFRGELASQHPNFKASSPAAAQEMPLSAARQILPECITTGRSFDTSQNRILDRDLVDESMPLIKYSEEDDKCIEEWIQDNVSSAGFTMGTCAMKHKDQGGCVDKHLNVYGTENLKVADLSIMQEMSSGTSAITLLIGEMCAEIVAKDLGDQIKTPHLRDPSLRDPNFDEGRGPRRGDRGRKDKDTEDSDYVQ